jgi:TolB-like protein
MKAASLYQKEGTKMRSRTSQFFITWVVAGILAFPHPGVAADREFGSQAPLIAEEIAKSGKQRIAVVDFTDLQGNVTELGRFLAEELSVSLAAAAKGFDVIDRTHLENLLAEHRLSTRGLIDPQTTQKLKVAGVQGLLTGTVIPLGDTVRLTLKVLDVETARISAPTVVDIPKTPAIQALIERGVDREPETLPTSGVPGGARQRKVVQNVAFDLKGCRSAGGKVVCSFAVTSTEADIFFYLRSDDGARVVDEEGGEFSLTEIMIGGSRRNSATLAVAVPMSMSVAFPLPEKARKLSLLELFFNNSPTSSTYKGSSGSSVGGLGVSAQLEALQTLALEA